MPDAIQGDKIPHKYLIGPCRCSVMRRGGPRCIHTCQGPGNSSLLQLTCGAQALYTCPQRWVNAMKNSSLQEFKIQQEPVLVQCAVAVLSCKTASQGSETMVLHSETLGQKH